MPEASGSRQRPQSKTAKNGSKSKKPNAAKQRRLTEKQQIEALERAAMAFVSVQGLHVAKRKDLLNQRIPT
jgi:hypothetical protein